MLLMRKAVVREVVMIEARKNVRRIAKLKAEQADFFDDDELDGSMMLGSKPGVSKISFSGSKGPGFGAPSISPAKGFNVGAGTANKDVGFKIDSPREKKTNKSFSVADGETMIGGRSPTKPMGGMKDIKSILGGKGAASGLDGGALMKMD
jgi:hypothetical protein